VGHFLGLQQLRGQGHPEHTQQLSVDGYYRYVRHPLYAFSLIFIWLTPLMSWNILAFNIGATLYLTIGTFFEEQKLRMEYGEEYATYAKKTPMLMPGWGFWRK
jgi:protein-S-isoprenylcysteine O-methyltransferase Ste14